MESAVNFFHLGMSVSAYGSPRVQRAGSTSRALLEHRWYIGGMKLACFPETFPIIKFNRADTPIHLLRYLLRLQTSKFLKRGTVRSKSNGSRLLSCILHARALRKKQSYNVDCSRNSAEFLRSKLQPGSKLFRPRRLSGGVSCTRLYGWSCFSFLRLFFTSFWAARKKVSHVL